MIVGRGTHSSLPASTLPHMDHFPLLQYGRVGLAFDLCSYKGEVRVRCVGVRVRCVRARVRCVGG